MVTAVTFCTRIQKDVRATKCIYSHCQKGRQKSTHLDIFKLFTGVRVKIQLLLLVLFSIQTFLSSRKTINHSAASSCDSSSGTVQFESPFGHFHIIVPVALERGCNCHIKPH